MQRIYIVSSLIRGLFCFERIVGSSCIIVYVVKWEIKCVLGNGPIYGEKFWYQFISGRTMMVMVFGSFLAANLAQCSVWWAISSLCGCAYPIPFHLH